MNKFAPIPNYQLLEPSYPPFVPFLHKRYEIRRFCRNFANYFQGFEALTIHLQHFPQQICLTGVKYSELIHYNEAT
jgi:hypothetical protein